MSTVKEKMKTPGKLSARAKALRDYFFEGLGREWNNEYTCYTTGTPWDTQFDELNYYIVPETYMFHKTFRASIYQAAETIPLPDGFWDQPLPVRKAMFTREAVVNHLPKELLPGDLLCGARFNMMTSMCWTKAETKRRDKLVSRGSRPLMKWFHDHGYGNAGPTGGHLIPDYAMILRDGFCGVIADLDELLVQTHDKAKRAQLEAMKIAAEMPIALAEKYARLCEQTAAEESHKRRQAELIRMTANLRNVPKHGASSFHEAVQSLWLTHMLVMADENYPGPGVSFGRLDQILYPYYEQSKHDGVSRKFMKDVLSCFWVHCNTAYDAQIKVGGNQGITAGFGQLFNLSGLGEGGADMTNDLTYLMLEVIDEMSPILEPKPNVRLHSGTPEKLLDTVVDMVTSSQGAPFLLNFDERSMAGMLREAKEGGVEHFINEDNVHEYACVGCLENTMVGNDRSGTVDCNLNLVKAVELAITGGYDIAAYTDELTGKTDKRKRFGEDTGNPETLDAWEKFYDAYTAQTKYIIKKITEVYEAGEKVRAEFSPTPYLSLLVHGCAESGKDVTQGGAELSFVTIEGVTFATTVDALLAVKYLVYDEQLCTLPELQKALEDNWDGHDVLQAYAKNRAPKYGRDDDTADALAQQVMDMWTSETWQYKTKSTNRQYRPGMLSWNYWAADGGIVAATADGRRQGQFLSNAICPSNGVDIHGPTANTNSVGKALGGRAADGGDYQDYLCSLPNGASHTITFNASMLDSPGHKEKFKAFLRGYIQNGGTALQINILDSEMLRDAQKNPEDYRHLLVRVTGYNAYFTSVGKELQDEIIARNSHEGI